MVKKTTLFWLLSVLILISFSMGIPSPAEAACNSECNQRWQEVKNDPNITDKQWHLKTLCGGPNCNDCSFCTLGTISLPSFFTYGPLEGGLGNFLNNILMLISTVAGLFALFNFIMAGYGYMSANGEEKKVQQAWAKIWQSLLGLGIIAAAFLIAALVG